MPRVLVCPPRCFGVEYVINPWMAEHVGAGSAVVAQRQWDALIAILAQRCDVSAIEPAPGLPDMCFTANGGLACGGAFVPPTFRFAERGPEAARYRAWAAAAGFDVVEIGSGAPFEGEGDALWWPRPGGAPLLCAGYGPRTALAAHRALAGRLGARVVSLRLIDARFYHLDTCFAPLPAGRVVWYPPAFDARSRRIVAALAPAGRRIEVGDADALGFACNAVRLGRTLIAPRASDDLRRRLAEWEYDVVTTPLSEFIKAGGAAKCLTLTLDQQEP